MKKEQTIHWEQDSATGLFLPKVTTENLATKKELAAASFAEAERFSDAFNRISMDPRVLEVIHKKTLETFCGWAVMKMGLRLSQ